MSPIRSILSISFALLFASSLLAQGPYPTTDRVAKFSSTKLLVVVDGRDVAFDALLRDAVSKHWTLTEFDFVDGETFIKEKANPGYSFLVTLQVQFDKDPQENTYNFLYLLLSHPTGDVQAMPVLAQVPISGSTFTSSNHLHKAPMLIKFIQNYASDVVASKGSKRYRKLSHLNKGIKELKGKTLYLSKNQITPQVEVDKDILKLYRNNHNIVSDDELLSIISKAEKDAVVFHIVAPDDEATSGKCFKMIIEPATGKGYFYNTHNISDKHPPVILKRDFRNIRWYPFHFL